MHVGQADAARLTDGGTFRLLVLVEDDGLGQRPLRLGQAFLQVAEALTQVVALVAEGLALEHDAPMVVIGVPRVGRPMKFALETEDVIDPRDYAGQPGAIKAITERFTRAFERLVRRHPEQYFWLHRRCGDKSRPAVKRQSAGAQEPGCGKTRRYQWRSGSN